jgi:alpha-glucosidase
VGAHLPFFRIHSSLESPPQEPWRFGTKFESFARAAIAHRYALLPYLYTLAHKAAAVGAPMVQPLFVKFPSDPVVRRMADEWLLGEDLLVAPQLRAATPVRAVYLPPSAGDEWVAWGKEGVDSRPWAVLATPLDTPPVYQRVGSAVPLTKGMSRAASARWDSLMWRVAIGERACGVRGEVVADDGDGGGIDAVDKVCTSSLEGTFDGCRLSLHLKEGGVREATDRKVWVQILGRGAPVSCSAPWGIRDGHVTFRIGSTVELEW